MKIIDNKEISLWKTELGKNGLDKKQYLYLSCTVVHHLTKYQNQKKDIINLAGLSGCIPSSVGLKMVNLAYYDPRITETKMFWNGM